MHVDPSANGREPLPAEVDSAANPNGGAARVHARPAPPALAQSAPQHASRVARRTLFFTLPPLLAALLGALVGVAVAASINVPTVESLTELSPGVITQLYDDQGRPFQTYFRERRVMLKEGEVPLRFQNALVAMEDQNFFRHGGLDAQGVVRAAMQNLVTGKRGEGASTLTMQLARMLFLTPEKTWRRKIREAFLAVELEKHYSKQQILTLYCNLVNLGSGNYGVEAAAQDYFNKPAAELEMHEAATLVAIAPRPSEWTPRRRPDFVLARRNAVLGRMLEEGYATAQEHDAAVAQPFLIAPKRQQSPLGAYFAEEVRRTLYATYGEKSLYERGLQVHTTLHPAAQRAAEEALRHGLVAIDRRRGFRGPRLHLAEDELESQELPSWAGLELGPGTWAEGIVLQSGSREATVKIANRTFTLRPEGYEWTRQARADRLLRRGDVAWFALELPEEPPRGEAEAAGPTLVLAQEPELEGAVLLLESATGAVRAMVGGWSFERNEFNRATQAQRQIGSAFKPFVFGAALEMGYTPADTLFDAPCVFAGADNAASYSPRNFYRKYYGIVTLRQAIEKSINVTSVKLLDLVGVERVVDFAHRAGITSVLPPYPSLALGVAELSPIELAAAFATIANQGFHVEPYTVEGVTTPDGRLLEQHQPRASKAMEPNVAYVLSHVLEGVIDRGTATAVADLDVDLAGKTGTTDGYTDAWFAGFTPTHTLVVWVGFDLKKTIGRNMTGAEAALPIWREITERGLQEGWIPRAQRFSVPTGVVTRWVEHETGLLATPQAAKVLEEGFLPGTEPAQTYDPKWARILELPWYQQRPFYGIPKEGENMPEDIEDWSLVLDARKAAGEGGSAEER